MPDEVKELYSEYMKRKVKKKSKQKKKHLFIPIATKFKEALHEHAKTLHLTPHSGNICTLSKKRTKKEKEKDRKQNEIKNHKKKK